MTMKLNGYYKFMADLNYLKQLIDEENFKDPYVGLRIAEYRFKEGSEGFMSIHELHHKWTITNLNSKDRNLSGSFSIKFS